MNTLPNIGATIWAKITPRPADPKKKPMAIWVCSMNHALKIFTRFELRAEMPAPSMNIATICRANESLNVRRNAPSTAMTMQTSTTFLGPMRSPKVPAGMLRNTAVSIGMSMSIEKPASSIENIGMM